MVQGVGNVGFVSLTMDSMIPETLVAADRIRRRFVYRRFSGPEQSSGGDLEHAWGSRSFAATLQYVLAALIGGDLGPRFLPLGSLAGLLWLDSLPNTSACAFIWVA